MIKNTIAVVLAAGFGKRMNSDVRKQYLLIHNKPLLYYTLKAFEDSFIDEIILVVGDGEEEYCRQTIVNQYGFTKISAIVAGGRERYHSVYNALTYVEKNKNKAGYVFIHDGARPFVTKEILERAYECVKKEDACIVGMPVKDTIKVVDACGVVADTPDRNSLWLVQTPQVFSFPMIKEAYDKLIQTEEAGALQIAITDDAMVMETFGDTKVCVVEGSYENIKITTPDDIILAEHLLSKS